MAEISTLARPYARAAFQSADEQQSLSSWSAGLALLAGLMTDAKVKELMASPHLRASVKTQALLELSGEQLPVALHPLVGVLADAERLSLMAEIRQQFESLRAEREKRVPVQIETALALNDEQIKLLSAKLELRFSKAVDVTVLVKPELIGGIVIRTEQEVIDGSVRTRLQDLAQTTSA